MVVLERIIQAIGVLLAKIERRIEELSAVCDLESGNDSQELPKRNVSFYSAITKQSSKQKVSFGTFGRTSFVHTIVPFH